MSKLQSTRLVVGLLLALACPTAGFAQAARSNDRETLARAEERAEALRAKLFDMQMAEMDLQRLIDELDYRMTPECIQRVLAFVGTPRPMDEVRETLRTRLESEKSRVVKRLELLVESRERLEAQISRADVEVERLRERLSLE